MMPKVSRTFAIAVDLLDLPMREWVRTSYLLCRVADTVEDAPELTWHRRGELFDAFTVALRSADASAFRDLAFSLPDDDEGELALGLARVLSVLGTFPPTVRASVVRWVEEMVEGMRVYAARRESGGGIEDEADLLRYCHYVAGTVGQLLTDLFTLEGESVARREAALRAEAEAFGLLLQLTNVAKDLEEDLGRGVCFVPQSLLDRHGVGRDQLFVDRARTRRVVLELVALARRHVPAAERYVAALPADARSIRRFCALPLALAVRTLDVLEADPTGGVRKVDRATVLAIVSEVHAM
jgi:farnesyl-diphosphate farnesyltransferase